MSNHSDDRSILITGCSSGIGLDAAKTLRERGWQVFASCRKPSDCERLKSEGFDSPHLDYADEASIVSAVETVLLKTGGKLGALFNNGAFAVPGAVEDVPRAALREIYETNLFGYHDLTTKIIPVMRKQGSGRIINCSSILGFVTLPWRGPYNSTKFALEGLTETMRVELRGTGIHVSLIEPGPITTKIRVNSRPHFEKWIDWEESPHRTFYKKALIPSLNKPDGGIKDPFELSPDAVTRKLVHALESRRPKTRYFVTTPTYIAAFLKRVLPAATVNNMFGLIK